MRVIDTIRCPHSVTLYDIDGAASRKLSAASMTRSSLTGAAPGF